MSRNIGKKCMAGEQILTIVAVASNLYVCEDAWGHLHRFTEDKVTIID